MIHFDITNFQRFQKVSLTFRPGFGCIVGKSNSGKSSILRALFLILRNSYSPSFLRKGEKELLISLLWDEYSLQCSVTKPQNTYTVNGSTYPKAGKSSLNTYLSKPSFQPLHGQDLNLQSQFSGLFLLSQTPQNINLFFTQFLGASSFQTALDLVNSDFREITQDLNRDLQPQLLSLSPLLTQSLEILSVLDGIKLPPLSQLISDIDLYLSVIASDYQVPDFEPLSLYLQSYLSLLYLNLFAFGSIPSIPEVSIPFLHKLLETPPEPLEISFEADLDSLEYLTSSIETLSSDFSLPSIPEPPELPSGMACPLCGGVLR